MPVSVSPSVPVPPVGIVECHHVVGEKIRATASAVVCQCCFGDYRIAFQKPCAWPDCRIGAYGHVSDDVGKWFEPSLVTELHLGQVAALMDGK